MHNKFKVSFTEPISNVSTIKYEPASDFYNTYSSEQKNLNLNLNRHSFNQNQVIDEKGESNCPSSLESKPESKTNFFNKNYNDN